MASKCGCGGAVCACFVQGDGATTSVSGVGSASAPYVITAFSDASTTVGNTATVDMSITGAGTIANPYDILANANISAMAGNNLVAETDGLFVPTGAATVSVGCGITGDGSAGNPLVITTDGATFVEEDLQFGAFFPPVTVPNNNVFVDAGTATVTYTNPSACYSIQMLVIVEWDGFQTVVPGSEMGVAIDGDTYWVYDNNTAVNQSPSWQLARAYTETIAPGGTLAFTSTVSYRTNFAAGGTYQRLQARIHAIAVGSK